LMMAIRSRRPDMTPREFRERLLRRARRAGMDVGEELAEALETYFRLLDLWNTKINLTALSFREEPDQAIDRLLVEPLVAARHLPGGAVRLLDIGSGGGSPAIPLKLAAPGIHLRMVESKTRKSAFLREAVRHLKVEGAVVETARFEELLARPELHEAHDVVSLRAVRVESRVLMTLQAFLKPGGLIFLFRGPVGPDVPPMLNPPLAFDAVHPLVEALRSRLVLLRKMPLRGQGAGLLA
jgi:16S rRNA (guanine527-N7)-methyltransferase